MKGLQKEPVPMYTFVILHKMRTQLQRIATLYDVYVQSDGGPCAISIAYRECQTIP